MSDLATKEHKKDDAAEQRSVEGRQGLLGWPPTARSLRSLLPVVWHRGGMFLVFLVLFVAVSLSVSNFLSFRNMEGLLLSVVTIGMIACTMLFCLASGDFDLSVGSVVAMAGVLAVVVSNATGSMPAGIAAGVAAGGMVGLVNGIVIARIGINALITTLAMMQIARGLAFIIAPDGRSVGARHEGFLALGTSSFLYVPTPVWILIGCFIVFGLLLNRTIFGRNTLAVGGNYEAARLAGIRVVGLKIVIFSLQGMMAAFAGVILASRVASGQPNIALGLELQVISACVLGGVSLTGGVGTMLGVVSGVLIMGTVQNVMNLLNIPFFYQYVASGGILLAAVLIDRLRHRG